jgi:hypothetical protein
MKGGRNDRFEVAPGSSVPRIPPETGKETSRATSPPVTPRPSHVPGCNCRTLTCPCLSAMAAWVVYRKLGLGLLRTAWFNVDWLWAGALVVTGVVVLLT